MSEDNQNEVTPEGAPRDRHDADAALHDEEALRTAKAAEEAERIAAEEQLSPKQRAKLLRKLSDEELLAMAEEATKAQHWLQVAQRSQAEMENTIRRVRRDSQDDLKYASSSLVRELLPVLDNLSRALQAASQSEDFKSLRDGVELTNKMFNDALSRHGVKPIEAAGAVFDPAVHEALMTANNPELDDNAVAMELERGWKLHDRVLRASKVQVNKR